MSLLLPQEHPVSFYREVWAKTPSEHETRELTRIYDALQSPRGSIRVGVRKDNAQMAVGLVMWRLLQETAVPTIVWGGRNDIRRAWVNIIGTSLELINTPRAAAAEKHPTLIGYYDKDTKLPLVVARSEWDNTRAIRQLGLPFDVLIPDFEWIDRETLDDAVEFTERHGTILTIIA